MGPAFELILMDGSGAYGPQCLLPFWCTRTTPIHAEPPFFFAVKERSTVKKLKKIPIIGENAKWPLQWKILQIEGANRIALPSWQCLDGRLRLEPIEVHQFRCEEVNRAIEHPWLQLKSKTYKLSPLSSMQTTHNPRSMLRKL